MLDLTDLQPALPATIMLDAIVLVTPVGCNLRLTERKLKGTALQQDRR